MGNAESPSSTGPKGNSNSEQNLEVDQVRVDVFEYNTKTKSEKESARFTPKAEDSESNPAQDANGHDNLALDALDANIVSLSQREVMFRMLITKSKVMRVIA